MAKQLEINFKVGGHYFFAVDGKNDFVAYNIDNYTPTNEPVDLVELKYEKITSQINKLNSEVWSCNCKFYFIFQDEGIYLMNIYSNEMWLNQNHSKKFIEMYLDNVGRKKLNKNCN